MRFRILGADRETGEDCTFDIDAGNSQEARKKANDLGFLVSSAIPIELASEEYRITHGLDKNTKRIDQPDALSRKQDIAEKLDDKNAIGCLIGLLFLIPTCVTTSCMLSESSKSSSRPVTKQQKLEEYHRQGRFRGYSDANELHRDMEALGKMGSKEAEKVARDLE